MELALGHREAALEAYRRGLDIRERIARDYGETPESLRDLVLSACRLAAVDMDAENKQSAVAHLHRAKELTQRIFDAGWGLPQNEEDRRWIDEMLRRLTA